MSDIAMLVEMGFSKERAEYAIRVTNNKGVEPAMEWLLAHAGEEVPSEDVGMTIGASGDTTESPQNNTTSSKETTNVGIAKSFKCDDCGKLCKDDGELSFHAAKTGHSNFSESTEEKKPLTEEEKKRQLALIEEKLKLKRLEREEREKADALEREKTRIKLGKDMTEARKRLEEMEIKKLIEQRKREKEEEKIARERVKAQIEADKERRRLRQHQKQTPHNLEATTSSTAPQINNSDNANIIPKKEYTKTRIQIRLYDGSTLTETFDVKEQLSAVRLFIQMKANITEPFGLMTSFPRKVFSYDDFEKPLEVLGLVPSAVLIMTKSLNN